jgi:chitinase
MAKHVRSTLARAGALILLPLLAACASQTAYIPTVSESFRLPADFKMVGYFPSWSGEPKTIQYRALTHICYAFATPTMEGGFDKIEHEDKLIALVTKAHANKVKVLLSMGGWNTGEPNAYDTIAADPTLLSTFSENTMTLIARYCLDGIDMDWEFPTASTAQIFADLMHALSEKLHVAGKQLSIAVSADATHGQYYLDGIIQDVDFLNIMAYDDGYGTPNVHHSTYWFARAALDYWMGTRQVPKAKAILGVPFYGRSLKDRHSKSYFLLRKADPRASASDVSGEFGYNGFDTLRAKAVNLARVRGGGIMIWQLNQDANGSDSLLNAIFDAVKEPVEPSIGPGSEPSTPAGDSAQ